MMKKKELIPVVDPINPMIVRVKYVGGGELPPQLTGMFTSKTEANKAIDAYERNKYIRPSIKEKYANG